MAIWYLGQQNLLKWNQEVIETALYKDGKPPPVIWLPPLCNCLRIAQINYRLLLGFTTQIFCRPITSSVLSRRPYLYEHLKWLKIIFLGRFFTPQKHTKPKAMFWSLQNKYHKTKVFNNSFSVKLRNITNIYISGDLIGFVSVVFNHP